MRADLLAIAAQDVDHGLSWCPGASREQNPESLNTTALIRSNRLRHANEPTSIQKQHPWIAKYRPDPSAILESTASCFEMPPLWETTPHLTFLVHRRAGASTSCNGSHRFHCAV